MGSYFYNKKSALLLKASCVAAVVVLLKWVMHGKGWEVISVSPLLAGIVSADVFLMGFLLSGVWVDYKESEKLPGEIACCLGALGDEATSIHHCDSSKGSAFLIALSALSQAIEEWFYKPILTPRLMERLEDFYQLFPTLEGILAANYIARMKQEHTNLRRFVTRVHTIRATRFVGAGYLIAQTITALLLMGLILARIEPLYEAVFFVGVISFMLGFMLLLIEDLDNPFGYDETASTVDVSLQPITDVVARLEKLAGGASPTDAVQGPTVPLTDR
jgi:predicted membrane chloride channel (bestrophin family)